MKWFVGLIIMWIPTIGGFILSMKLLEWTEYSSILIFFFLGLAATFILSFGRREGEFLDRWLNMWIKEDD